MEDAVRNLITKTLLYMGLLIFIHLAFWAPETEWLEHMALDALGTSQMGLTGPEKVYDILGLVECIWAVCCTFGYGVIVYKDVLKIIACNNERMKNE